MHKLWTDAVSLRDLVDRARTARFARGNLRLQNGRYTRKSDRKFEVAEKLIELRARFNPVTKGKDASGGR